MKPWEKLISALKRLPGVGPKQAERLALYLLRAPAQEVEAFLTAAREAKSVLRACRRCFDFTDMEICRICSDPGRDQGLLCLVEEPQDVVAIERTRKYHGLYHILHGALSPLDGVGPDSLRLRELMERVESEKGVLREVILATDPDTEGEATAIYVAKFLKSYGNLKISRIAQGVPLGGDLDYVDERTLGQAMAGRKEF